MSREISYTPHEKEVSYTNQYPDMIEFEKPWDNCIQVSQGDGKVSSEGKTLQSEGFAQCFGLILRNQSNLESALFHVDDIDLTHRQTPAVDELMRNYVNSLDIDSCERETLLAAMDDITHYRCPQNYGRMRREDFQSRMEELNADGIMQARFIYGDESRDVKCRIVGSLFGFLGIKVVDDLRVNTDQAHWSMAYKPQESTVLVDARKQRKVLSYSF